MNTGVVKRLAIGLWALVALALAQPVAATRYESVAAIGNWNLYRNNAARPFVNYFAPLAIGLGDTSGRAAVVIDCRPKPGALNPGPYSVRTGQFYLDFLPSFNGIVSNPWYTPVSFWSAADELNVFASRLPFVSGILLDKLGFNRDGLFDSAQTMVTMPVALTRELGNQLGGSDAVVARFFDMDGQRHELTFNVRGYADAMATLKQGCDLINSRFGP